MEKMNQAKIKGELKKSKKGKSRKTRNKEPPKESWSITICESGENHTGMEILGKKASAGMSCEL